LGEPARIRFAHFAPSGYPLHHLHGFASLTVSVVPLLSLSLARFARVSRIAACGFRRTYLVSRRCRNTDYESEAIRDTRPRSGRKG
jgi:hypothetical protein